MREHASAYPVAPGIQTQLGTGMWMILNRSNDLDTADNSKSGFSGQAVGQHSSLAWQSLLQSLLWLHTLWMGLGNA
jgi:hypothetical protein